jgi:cytochrome P450
VRAGDIDLADIDLADIDLADIDLADLDVFERGAAWPLFDLLRREAPVHRNPEAAPNAGFWSLTRHADVARVTRDPETRSAGVGRPCAPPGRSVGCARTSSTAARRSR